MKNLKLHGETYTRLYQKDENHLMKYSRIPQEVWKSVVAKNISFINCPTKILPLTKEEKQIDNYRACKIILPLLKNYETLCYANFINNLNTEELLNLITKIITLVKKLHKKDIYHGDIYSENIMINQNNDLQFIDLEAMVTGTYVSEENTYSEDNLSLEKKKELTMRDDKLSILSLLLYYLSLGTFKDQMNDYIELRNLALPKPIEKEISSYQLKLQTPSTKYYFEDIIEDLLKQGYESPKIYNRKK